MTNLKYLIDMKLNGVMITIQFFNNNELVCQEDFPEGIPIPGMGTTVIFDEEKKGTVAGVIYRMINEMMHIGIVVIR